MYGLYVMVRKVVTQSLSRNSAHQSLTVKRLGAGWLVITKAKMQYVPVAHKLYSSSSRLLQCTTVQLKAHALP